MLLRRCIRQQGSQRLALSLSAASSCGSSSGASRLSCIEPTMVVSCTSVAPALSPSRSISTSTSSPSSDQQETTHFGFQTVPKTEKKGLVGEVFSSVASTYDLMNDVMSLRIHRLWKDAFVKRLNPQPGVAVLDIAGGTGDIAFRIASAIGHNGQLSMRSELPDSRIVVADINADMLAEGEKRAASRAVPAGVNLEWALADAEALQFDDNSFDAVTCAFGVRNMDVAAVLPEFYRVLKPGGRLLVLEFSRVTNGLLRSAYSQYSFNVIPLMGDLIAKDRDSYQYLVESIRQFPRQEEFAAMFQDAGFRDVSWKNYTAGIVAVHSGFKV